MSPTAPVPTLRRSVALVWRSLRSMRTALVLLLLLALAAVAGSLVPQVGVADARIAATFRDHPLRARIFDQLGLFDVYGSWWFTMIYTLLLVSLIACLVPRTRAFVRNLRARPVPARELDAMRHYAELAVGDPPEQALGRARSLLRRRLFRVSGPNGAPTVSADKGLGREGGSLLFHAAFLVLLVGVVLGRGTGFSGQAVIVEGQTWTEAHANYDGTVREGRFFGEDHSGVQVRVEDFRATYRPTGQPRDFVTRATLLDAEGGELERVDIRVNHPAEAEGVKFYQFGYGWAPVIRVEEDGEAIFDGPVVCQQETPPEDVSQLQVPWTCVVKLPSLDPQVGIRFELWPDRRGLLALLETGEAMPMLVEYAPVMTWEAFEGDLRAELVQSVGVLDTSAMRPLDTGVLGAGETVDLRPGLTVGFTDLRQYTVLSVSRDRGLWIVLAAAILILLGLLPALYTSRRKLWVTAEAAGAGTLLKVGGFALQRRSQFEEEFSRLVRDLRRVPEERVGS
ncbi:MAG TPA: cytochrome c biogenesis protein ResB [Actinomycetota bacterium]|nr:cytochrome c biogenesis protein ResB [Actinomycetota bacterium]